MMTGRPRIGLALSGGGARGLAHVGVLSVLLEAGIPIDMVAGTSAGALIGGSYCAGLSLARLREFAGRVNWRYMARLSPTSAGLMNFRRMEHWLNFLLGDLRFCDLLVPFAAVATDLDSGKPVVLSQGRVARAISASCSIQGIFVPVTIDGHRLVDGGISDNLPVDVVRRMGADYIIGVDLMEPYLKPQLGPLGPGLFSLETMIERSGGGPEEADCVIRPGVYRTRFLYDFRYRKEILALGEVAARRQLPAITEALQL